jgi:hypothetical protein
MIGGLKLKHELFDKMRELTKEESKAHEESIYKMFKQTGENINKFYEGYEPKGYFEPCEGYIPVINL